MSDKRRSSAKDLTVASDSDVYELGYDLDEMIVADSPARLKALGNHLRALILDPVL